MYTVNKCIQLCVCTSALWLVSALQISVCKVLYSQCCQIYRRYSAAE